MSLSLSEARTVSGVQTRTLGQVCTRCIGDCSGRKCKRHYFTHRPHCALTALTAHHPHPPTLPTPPPLHRVLLLPALTAPHRPPLTPPHYPHRPQHTHRFSAPTAHRHRFKIKKNSVLLLPQHDHSRHPPSPRSPYSRQSPASTTLISSRYVSYIPHHTMKCRYAHKATGHPRQKSTTSFPPASASNALHACCFP